MTDASGKKGATESTTCPWCSAAVPVEASKCPSCGAALRDGAAGEVAGVTQIDLAATSRLARMKPPGRIATWLGAERTTDDPALAGKIEPPSEAVRKEMLRLELAAIEAEIEAKNAQLAAERSLPPEDGSTPPAALSESATQPEGMPAESTLTQTPASEDPQSTEPG